MASYRIITNKDGSISYKITISLGRKPDGKQRLKFATFRPDPQKTEKQNLKALQKYIEDLERKSKPEQYTAEHTSLQKYSEHWLQTYGNKLEKSTRVNYENYLNNVILPRIGHLKLIEIRPSTVMSFLDDLRDNGYNYGDRKGRYSESAIQTAKKILSSILSWAVLNDILIMNPCNIRQRQHKRVDEKPQVKCLDVEQCCKFLDFIQSEIPIVVPEHTVIRNGKKVRIKEYSQGSYNIQLKYQAAFITTIFSGCRKEELLALQWRDVSFADKSIDINKAMTYIPHEGCQIKSTKSESSKRKLYLPDAVMKILRRLKAEQRQSMLSMGTAWKGSRNIEECFCIAQDDGSLMSPSTPRVQLQRAIKAFNKGCSCDEDKLPVITFHQLRHTNASILIAQGMDPTTVSQRLGHHDASVTLSIYAHGFAERNREASNILESVLIKREA